MNAEKATVMLNASFIRNGQRKDMTFLKDPFVQQEFTRSIFSWFLSDAKYRKRYAS
jgi:hypothetical protein